MPTIPSTLPYPSDQHHPTPGNLQTHACPMPSLCSGTYFFTLPLSTDSLHALSPDDLALLVAYLRRFRQFLVEHDMQPETARYVKALIEYVGGGMVEDSGIRGLRGGAGTQNSAVYSDSDDFETTPSSNSSSSDWERITDHVYVSKPRSINKHKPPQANKHHGIRLKVFGTIISTPDAFMKLYLSFGLACINGSRTLTRQARIGSMHWLQAEGELYRQFEHDWSTTLPHRHGTVFPDLYDFLQRDRELSAFERNLVADGILQLTRLGDTSLVLEEAPDADTKAAHAIRRAIADEISRREADGPEYCIRWDEAWRPVEMDGMTWVLRRRSACAERARRVVIETLAELYLEDGDLRGLWESRPVPWGEGGLCVYGAEFEGYMHGREYEDYITQCGGDIGILSCLDSGSCRLRWNKDGILEVANGGNVLFTPIWIDEPRVHEAYWRAYRRQHGRTDQEGYELCADLMYCDLRSGAYLTRLGLEIVEVDERIARGIVECVIRDGYVGGYHTRDYWARSRECDCKEFGRRKKEKVEGKKHLTASEGERKRQLARSSSAQPSLEEIQDLLDRARINLDGVRAEGEAGEEYRARTNNARLTGELRTPRHHGDSSAYDQDLATRSSRSGRRTLRDI